MVRLSRIWQMRPSSSYHGKVCTKMASSLIARFAFAGLRFIAFLLEKFFEYVFRRHIVLILTIQRVLQVVEKGRGPRDGRNNKLNNV